MASWQQTLGGREACEPANPATLQKHGGWVPEQLLAEWHDWGFCSYGGGLLWLVDPDSLSDVTELWFEEQPAPPCIARTAFGDLLVWDKSEGAIYVDVVYDNKHELGSDFDRLGDIFSAEEFRQDLLRKALFEEARHRLGALGRDEVYAFEPAPALGGPGTIETVHKAKFREYLALMAQFR
jgi:hypothetical protein